MPFDGARALRYLKSVCDIGPRISGTVGMTRKWTCCKSIFTALGCEVESHGSPPNSAAERRPTAMVNLIAKWHPERKHRLIICTHYDTRPIADQEPDRRDWYKPFVSANDGGSGVAFLMELRIT